ncbi:hypothetical protein RIF29_24868 [Crotalaria pallida]|uniref:Uncharacterized protein n=1 Tax=Crotalaria pallida TaxID=3830 RepID=A0AAN9ELA8_CROPI
MEEGGDTLSFGLSTASRTCPSRQKSHFGELLIDFDEEMNGDDELMTVYPCPYCSEDLDLLQLCCHIDLDHPLEAKSGICPVCATWVVTNMVDHITAQHGNIFKISFPICMIMMFLFIQDLLICVPVVSFYQCLFTIPLAAFVLYPTNYATSFTEDYSLLKSKRYKHESNPTHSFSKKDLDDELWPSISAGLSPEMSTSKSAHDPLLAFLYTGAADDRSENVHPDTSSEDSSIEEIHSEETVLERDVQPSLSNKDRIEKAQRSEFVQGLLMSILDPDF